MVSKTNYNSILELQKQRKCKDSRLYAQHRKLSAEKQNICYIYDLSCCGPKSKIMQQLVLTERQKVLTLREQELLILSDACKKHKDKKTFVSSFSRQHKTINEYFLTHGFH